MAAQLFGSIDYWAVFIAAVAGFALGAVWYRAFSTPWLAANGMTKEMLHADPGARSPLPFITAFVGDIAMAFVLFGVIWHIGGGHFTINGGVITGALCWLGFVITTMAVNSAFSRRKPILLAIDGGFWLVTLALMGAIIGGLGPK
jgi:Protein of unknown function (DUF1761)